MKCLEINLKRNVQTFKRLEQMEKQPFFLARAAQHYSDVRCPTLIYKFNAVPKKYQQPCFFGVRQVDLSSHGKGNVQEILMEVLFFRITGTMMTKKKKRKQK